MPRIKFSCKNTSGLLITISILAIFIGVLYQITPLYFDDLWYLRPLGALKSSLTTFKATTAEMWDHWHYDTGRLANIISPLFLALLPRWIFALLSALAFWIMMWYGVKLVQPGKQSAIGYLLVAALMVTLPWFEFAFTIIYGLNYLWSSAAVIFTLYYIVKLFNENHQPSSLKLAGICILSLIAGWMHEGFALPLACGMVVYAIILRQQLDRKSLLPLICFCLGLMLIAISPALWSRAGRTTSILMRDPLSHRILILGLFNCMGLLYVAVVICSLLCKQIKQRLAKADIAFIALIFTACVVSFLINCRFYVGPRTAWSTQLYGSIGCAYLLRFIHIKLSRHVATIIRATIAIALLSHIVYACYLQTKLSAEYNVIIENFLNTTDGQIYFDNIKSKPDLSLYKTSVRLFNETKPHANIEQFYGNHQDKHLTILPTSLQGFSIEKSSSVPSTPNLLLYNGNIIATDSTLAEQRTIMVSLNGHAFQSSRFFLIPFTCDDSTTRILIVPHITLFTDDKVTDIKI